MEKLYPIEWEIIVDASLRHRIDDRVKLERAIKIGKILQCPSKVEADKFILNFQKRHPENTIIISNDNFADHTISNLKLFKYVIMFDEIILDPDLESFLDKNIDHKEEAKINV